MMEQSFEACSLLPSRQPSSLLFLTPARMDLLDRLQEIPALAREQLERLSEATGSDLVERARELPALTRDAVERLRREQRVGQPQADELNRGQRQRRRDVP